MRTVLGVLDWLFSFTLMVLAVWLLVIASVFLKEVRNESADDDIKESWEDIRTAMRIHIEIIKNKFRRTK